MFTSWPPSTRRTYISQLPLRLEAKASRLPSGDQLGHSEKPGSRVRRLTWVTIGGLARPRRPYRSTNHITKAPSSTHANAPAASLDVIGALCTSGATFPAAATGADCESRLRRFKSARSSAAVWQRSSRSFSRAVLMISSSLPGRPGFKLRGDVGVRSNMAWKITPGVFPENAAGQWPSRRAPRPGKTGRCGDRALRRAPARATCRQRCRQSSQDSSATLPQWP